jgi:type II secretory ATPase GspE/PulE/Tfp pilus assembly ATPase PilB-like protein
MSHDEDKQVLSFLRRKGILGVAETDAYAARFSQKGFSLRQCLARDGVIGEENLMRDIAAELGLPFVDLACAEIVKDITALVPARFAAHYGIMPLWVKDDRLVIATASPFDTYAADDLSAFVGMEISTMVAVRDEIDRAISRYYGLGAATVERLVKEQDLPAAVVPAAQDDKSLIAGLVSTLVREALVSGATDIHLEPTDETLRVRFRIDGVLRDVTLPESITSLRPYLISRVKIMAGLDIAEKRLPQDGRIQMRVDGQDVDIRVSTMPLVENEGVHLRMLRQKEFLDLEALGCAPALLQGLESVIRKPNGIFLVTGPTGNGKSTTLYACLDRINSEDIKIITVEDPVEYRLAGVNQIQVRPKIGLTFAEGLRNILRHDPDVLMVGEIRDSETAEMAVRSALTGHLVFSTLHTNDAPSAITRLIDMGVEPFLIASSLECVMAQRLVRKLCPHCRRPVSVTKADEHFAVKAEMHFEAVGCDRCGGSGYKGRTGIFEVMVVDDAIRAAVLTRVPARKIREIAVQHGMRTLLEDGMEKVAAGVTSLAEIMRVIKEE